MDPKLAEEEAIRKFLLGTLAEPELGRLEEELLSSRDLSETAEMIAEEIVEQYLDGELGPDDKKAVETYFLWVPEHQEKMRFARLLRAPSPRASDPLPAPLPAVDPNPKPHGFLLMYGGATLAVVLSALCIYSFIVQSSLKKEVSEAKAAVEALQSQLREANARIAGLTPAETIAQLDLSPGVTRSGNASLPTAKIRPQTQFIQVDVILPRGWSQVSQVRLTDVQGNQQFFAESGLHLIPSPTAPRLVFVVPTFGLGPGKYTLVVSPQEGPGQSQEYPFDIHPME